MKKGGKRGEKAKGREKKETVRVNGVKE